MKKVFKPVRTSIFAGFLFSISLIPLYHVFLYTGCTGSLQIPFLIFLVCYSMLLVRWSGKSYARVFWPLLIAASAMMLIPSTRFFLIFLSAVLAWVRSGICFTETPGAKVTVESAICVTGMIIPWIMTGASLVSMAVGIWLFMLVQAVYFIIFPVDISRSENKTDLDPFESARFEAEKILSSS